MLGHLLTIQRLEQSVPEALKLYLDQMFSVQVAQALRSEAHDVLRASEIGKPGQMIKRYSIKQSPKIEFLLHLTNTSVIGLFSRSVNIQA